VKPQLVLAAASGLSAVAIGAFGAHGVTDPQVEDWIRTGVQYQLPHALAVFACLILLRAGAGRPARIAAWLFLAGSLLFSGSLYLIAATGVRTWGAVAPVGGALLIAAWAALAWAGLKADTRTGT
jgi:uncharacterized membrane protein YgdD (TMEM256/DUF423 family)